MRTVSAFVHTAYSFMQCCSPMITLLFLTIQQRNIQPNFFQLEVVILLL